MDQRTDINIGGVSAYRYAVSKGFAGTEEEFAALMANIGNTQLEIEAAIAAFTDTIVPAAVSAVNDAGTTKVADVNSAGAAQVQAIETAGTTQEAAVDQAGAAQVSAVNDAGTTKVADVNSAGAAQVQAIETAGTSQEAAVDQAGAAQVSAVNEAGTTKVADVNSVGAAQAQAIETVGTAQVQKVTDAGEEMLAEIQGVTGIAARWFDEISEKEDLTNHILPSIQAKMSWGQILRFKVGRLSILWVYIALDMSKNSPFKGTEVLTDEIELDDTYHSGIGVALFTSGNPNLSLTYDPAAKTIVSANYGSTYSTYNSVGGFAIGWIED